MLLAGTEDLLAHDAPEIILEIKVKFHGRRCIGALGSNEPAAPRLGGP